LTVNDTFQLSYKEVLNLLNSNDETKRVDVQAYMTSRNIPDPRDSDVMEWKEKYGNTEDKAFLLRVKEQEHRERVEAQARAREESKFSNMIRNARLLPWILWVVLTVVCWVFGFKNHGPHWGWVVPAIILSAVPICMGLITLFAAICFALAGNGRG
jgi:hypothetical protein